MKYHQHLTMFIQMVIGEQDFYVLLRFIVKLILTLKIFLFRSAKLLDVKYGIKTGANEFFYIVDETDIAESLNDEEYRLTFGVSKEKHKHFWETYGWFLSELTKEHFIIEWDYVRHRSLKSQREALNLDIDYDKLKYYVLYCNESKVKLVRQNKLIVKYINVGESRQHEIHKRPSVSGRSIWYDLTSTAETGDFIFPSKIGERFRLIDNRESQVFCDKVNYIIDLHKPYKQYADIIFLIMNSTLFRYFIDLFSRQMVVKVSDVDVNLVKKTLIINPALLKKHWKELSSVYKSIKSREQETIYEEVLKQDRFKLDKIILGIISLSDSDVRELHKEACKYVKDREEKAESLPLSKSKQKLDYEDSLQLIQDRIPRGYSL